MSLPRRLAPAAMVALAFSVSSHASLAEMLSLSLTSTTPTYGSQWASGAAGDGTFSHDFVGASDFTVVAQSGTSLTDGEQVQLFCIELAQNIGIGSTNPFTVVGAAEGSQVSPYTPGAYQTGLSANILETGIGSARATNLQILYSHVFGSTYNTAAAFGGSSTDYGAFQLAVWKLTQDDGFNLTSAAQGQPHLYITSVSDSSSLATSAMVNQAQAWLTWVQANPNAPQMTLDALNNNTVQDFIIPATSYFTEIPEPPFWALAAGSAVLLAALVGRRSAARLPA